MKKSRRGYEAIYNDEYGTNGENLAGTPVDIEFSILPHDGYDEKGRITI